MYVTSALSQNSLQRHPLRMKLHILSYWPSFLWGTQEFLQPNPWEWNPSIAKWWNADDVWTRQHHLKIHEDAIHHKVNGQKIMQNPDQMVLRLLPKLDCTLEELDIFLLTLTHTLYVTTEQKMQRYGWNGVINLAVSSSFFSAGSPADSNVSAQGGGNNRQSIQIRFQIWQKSTNEMKEKESDYPFMTTPLKQIHIFNGTELTSSSFSKKVQWWGKRIWWFKPFKSLNV